MREIPVMLREEGALWEGQAVSKQNLNMLLQSALENVPCVSCILFL